MEILILGTGCYNCLKLEVMVARLMPEAGLATTGLSRVDDPHRIRHFMSEEAIPGLVINGRLVSSGRLPDEAEVRQWLREAAQVEPKL
ncbi:MAG: thioredoxin family protein [Chloroflexota bacterium]